MCALKSAVSREMIVKYSQEDAFTVQEVLKDWTQFLQIQKQENNKPNLYRFYHESFRDFLQNQDIVKAAGVTLSAIKKLLDDLIGCNCVKRESSISENLETPYKLT
jgi:DNA-binding transcriptional MerR regulator